MIFIMAQMFRFFNEKFRMKYSTGFLQIPKKSGKVKGEPIKKRYVLHFGKSVVNRDGKEKGSLRIKQSEIEDFDPGT